MRRYILHIQKRIQEGVLYEMLDEVKWILRYSFHYKWQILWYIALGTFNTGMGLGIGVVSKYIIDAVTGYDSGSLLPAAVGFAAMNLFSIGVTAWSDRISAKIRVMVTQEIRADVFGKILLADWEALSEYHSGDLLNRVNNDVNTVATNVLGWIPSFITSLVQFLATLALIVYYDPTMAVLALLSAPVTLAMSQMLMRKMRTYNKKMLQVNSQLMSFNEEALQNIQYIKSFGLMKKYDQLFEKQQETYKMVNLEYNRFSILTSSFMSIVGMGVTGVCFGWGVYRLWSGAITYGTMTLFLQQAGNLSSSFSSLVYMVPTAITAATSAGRIMAVTELPAEQQEDTEETEEFICYARKKGGVTVAIEKISFGYQKGEDVLTDASFHVDPGEIVALVGPSGEGKTTMLRILLGLVSAREGAVWAQSGERKLRVTSATRRLFAYVPQGNTMMSGTIRENLKLLNSEASEEELWRALEIVCADDFVRNQTEGLDTYLKERGGGLSEGQLQRLSIARALLCDAPVLLLDEATSALDVATERKLLRNITESASGKTCIVTTHRPSVLNMCSRVYRIDKQNVNRLDEEGIQKIIMEF